MEGTYGGKGREGRWMEETYREENVEREGGSFLKRKVLDDKAFNANMLY